MLRVATSVKHNLTCSLGTQGAHVRPRFSLFPPFLFIYLIYIYIITNYLYFISPPIHFIIHSFRSHFLPIFVLKKLTSNSLHWSPISLSSATVFLLSNPNPSPFSTSHLPLSASINYVLSPFILLLEICIPVSVPLPPRFVVLE